MDQHEWPDAAALLRYMAENFLFDLEHPFERRDISPSATTPEGDTPLHFVAAWNDARAASLLIAAGADINAMGDMGETPLHVAAKRGSADVIRLLLQAGASTTIESDLGQTSEQLLSALGGDEN